MSKSETLKKIPTKNYVIAGVILLAIILGSIYIYSWYEVYYEESLSTSYLIDEKILITELNDYQEVEALVMSGEVPTEYFVLISYTGSEETHEFEKDMEDIINDYQLQDSMYYVNAIDMMQDDNYIERLNEVFELPEGSIDKLPTILYFKDGELVVDGVVKSDDDHMIDASDFVKLLDIKGFDKK